MLTLFHAAAMIGAVPMEGETGGSGDLLTAFTTGITANTPTIIGVFGAIIGLVFLIVLGNFIVRRVRGSVK